VRVLIAIPAQDRETGNWVTAQRFQKGLAARGLEIYLTGTGLDPEELQAAVNKWQPDAVLLLHAYRTGRPWLRVRESREIPAVMLLTGTDVNLGLDDIQQGPVIRQALTQASKVLFQNRLLTDIIQTKLEGLEVALEFLPPGIELGQTPYPLRQRHKIAPDIPLLLCPASLRPIKGVLPLLTLFDQVAIDHAPFHVAFCGPALDTEYSQRFLSALEQRPWASYLGIIPTDAMPSAMNEANIILNNSSAEGLPNALIEAAVLGKPILARDIPGNAGVVKDGHNGLLYQDDQSFAALAARLIKNPGLQQELSQPDPEHYDPRVEADSLQDVLVQAVVNHCPADITTLTD
jgi:glycosyltransferase involved in cell wall biosynthesis